jgi:hypothetical protein
MRAVNAQSPSGLPVVWFQTSQYSMVTEVPVDENYGAYSSTSAVMPNAMVNPSTLSAIQTGQTYVIDGRSGTVQPGGSPSAITIMNVAMNQLTAGTAAAYQGRLNPVCALPVYGQMSSVIEPAEQVLLMFSSFPVNDGTMLANALSPGLLVDLAGAQNRTVSYDVNQGWVWQGSWGRGVQAGESLPPILLKAQVAAV